MGGDPKEEEHRSILMEISQKLNDSGSRLKQLESQKRQLEIEIRRAAVTGGYLNEMPDDVPVYKALGKCYLLKSKQEMLEDLENSVKTKDADMKATVEAIGNAGKSHESLMNEFSELQKKI